MANPSERIDRSYRVSVYDEFVGVAWWPERPDLPPIWGLWDCSGYSLVCLDVGRGDPPARYFPTGTLPEELRRGEANGG